jgi:hypothetical protein
LGLFPDVVGPSQTGGKLKPDARRVPEPEEVEMQTKIRRVASAAAAAAMFLSGWGTASVQAQDGELPQTFTAMAADLGALGGRGTFRFEVRVTRWTTPAEEAQLKEALDPYDSARLAEVLREQPSAGILRINEGLGYDLRYAREFTGEDGARRVVLLTDRPIYFWEARARPRVTDYNISVIQLQLDDQGEGEGQFVIAARVTMPRPNRIEVENYALRPVKLLSVRQAR